MQCVYCGKPVDEWYSDVKCTESLSGWHSADPGADRPELRLKAPVDIAPAEDGGGDRLPQLTSEGGTAGAGGR